MKNEKTYLDSVQVVPEESTRTVEKSLVELQRNWVFWENYQLTEKTNSAADNNDWNEQIKKIFTFNDLISFWQFYNAYPGSDPKNVFYDGEKFILFFDSKKRIDGLNLFTEGISPEWEDPQNSGGVILAMQYDIKKSNEHEEFLNYIKDYWLKLILFLIGESMPSSSLVSTWFFNFN